MWTKRYGPIGRRGGGAVAPVEGEPEPTGSGKYLYVSTTGSDTYTRAQNDEAHPWLTVAKAMTSALAGDVVRFRAGTWTITTQLNMTGGSNCADGTAADRIVFARYPGESPKWAFAVSGGAKSNTGIYLGARYWTFYGLTMTASGFANESSIIFCDGEDHNHADHIVIDRCSLTVSSTSSADNPSCVRFQHEPAGYGIVRRSTLRGPVNGVQMFSTRNILIERCDIQVSLNGIYIKHPNRRSADYASTLRANYIHSCGQSGIRDNGNYTQVEHNLLVSTSNGSYILGESAGGCLYDGNTGGYDNTFDHNTVVLASDNGSIYRKAEATVANLTVSNTVLTYRSTFDAAISGFAADYNVYPSTNPGWPSDGGHSVTGAPTFVGGADPIKQYALAAGSRGKAACADGSDMGANIALVGPDGDED